MSDSTFANWLETLYILVVTILAGCYIAALITGAPLPANDWECRVYDLVGDTQPRTEVCVQYNRRKP